MPADDAAVTDSDAGKPKAPCKNSNLACMDAAGHPGILACQVNPDAGSGAEPDASTPGGDAGDDASTE